LRSATSSMSSAADPWMFDPAIATVTTYHPKRQTI
jgi:hypothetical protein